jgi:hypothetical protein
MVIRVLADMARHAGFNAVVEEFEGGLVSGGRTRPDIYLKSQRGEEIVVDVAIAHPITQSRLQGQQDPITQRIQAKTIHYRQYCASNNFTFYPAVASTLGEMSDYIVELVQRIAMHWLSYRNATVPDVPDLEFHLIKRLSVELMNSNEVAFSQSIHRSRYTASTGSILRETERRTADGGGLSLGAVNEDSIGYRGNMARSRPVPHRSRAAGPEEEDIDQYYDPEWTGLEDRHSRCSGEPDRSREHHQDQSEAMTDRPPSPGAVVVHIPAAMPVSLLGQ